MGYRQRRDRRPTNFDRYFVLELLRHPRGDFRYGQAFVASNVVRSASLSQHENCPKPDSQIGGIKIRAHGCTVALDNNWATIFHGSIQARPFALKSLRLATHAKDETDPSAISASSKSKSASRRAISPRA